MLNKQTTYMVLNYNTSPVSVKMRDKSELIPAGSDFDPSGIPLTFDEILYINSTSKAFKIGILRFEEEFEADIYNELRIRNWEKILKNTDIYDILLNPSVDSLEEILAIEDQMYFDRVYGAYIGLKNAGENITANIISIMDTRYKEFRDHKLKTRIVLQQKDVEQKNNSDEIKAMQDEMERMRKLIETLTAQNNAEHAEAKKATKSSTKTTTKKTEQKEEA